MFGRDLSTCINWIWQLLTAPCQNWLFMLFINLCKYLRYAALNTLNSTQKENVNLGWEKHIPNFTENGQKWKISYTSLPGYQVTTVLCSLHVKPAVFLLSSLKQNPMLKSHKKQKCSHRNFQVTHKALSRTATQAGCPGTSIGEARAIKRGSCMLTGPGQTLTFMVLWIYVTIYVM
jgi:hypothetical protein